MIVSNVKDVVCAYRKYFFQRFLNIKYAQFSPLFTGATCAQMLPIQAEKLIFYFFMTPLARTGFTSEKLLKREICRIKASTKWGKLRINIAYSSGEIKL